jgi:hypothetical protein
LPEKNATWKQLIFEIFIESAKQTGDGQVSDTEADQDKKIITEQPKAVNFKVK